MNASILAIGTEMLGPHRLDTNSLRITEAFERHSVSLEKKSVVGDDRAVIVSELASMLDRTRLVIVSGGLGPTADDLTKEAVAELLGLELELDETVLESIRRRFADRGLEMPEVNRKQALVFPGQQTLHNDRGSAPGFHLSISWNDSQRDIWLFPGVPPELQRMVERYLEPWLESFGRPQRHRRTVHLAGLAESHIEETLAPFYAAHADLQVTILAGGGEIQISIAHSGAVGEAAVHLDGLEAELRELFGERVFGTDQDTLEEVVGRLLSERGETISTAESCTAGGLGERITSVPGSSQWFIGGVIAYSGAVKTAMLDVSSEVIREHGEVSEAVARGMAEGARRRFGTDWGVGITGIAGPGGGRPGKPVGTVHVALAWSGGSEHERLQLSGDRDLVRTLSAMRALEMLRRRLLSRL